eukprot:3348800-Prymnesium_polylepis.1
MPKLGWEPGLAGWSEHCGLGSSTVWQGQRRDAFRSPAGTAVRTLQRAECVRCPPPRCSPVLDLVDRPDARRALQLYRAPVCGSLARQPPSAKAAIRASSSDDRRLVGGLETMIGSCKPPTARRPRSCMPASLTELTATGRPEALGGHAFDVG